MKDLPAVVGELVAIADSLSNATRMYNEGRTTMTSVAQDAVSASRSIRAVADRLSALTAEAGKGAVATLVAAANSVLAENPHDDTMWSLEAAVSPFNARKPDECANGCPPQQVCDYCQIARLALSTATPAGEWETVMRGLLEAAVCPMAANGCDGEQYPVGDPYGDFHGEQCQFCYERKQALAASPRGASESGNG